jgi:hypothetical protein
VRDDRALGQCGGDRLRDLLHAGRAREIVGREAGEPLHRARNRSPRLDQGLDGGDPARAGVEQRRAEFDDLGAGVAREPRGLEVDDGERPAGGEQRSQSREVDPELFRLAPPLREVRARLRRRCRP